MTRPCFLLGWPHGSRLLVLAAFCTVAPNAEADTTAVTSTAAVTPQQVEADWQRQTELRNRSAATSGKAVTPEEDAGGGVDGVKNGKWGFHTEHEDQPWWQVDLGQPMPVSRLVLYNRCDRDMGKRNGRLTVLLSDDGSSFRKAYQHDGTDFLGQPDGKPLVVHLENQHARFLRLQLPTKSYFHLDEVEVYSSGTKGNVALHKPATQSSTSQWSVRHQIPPSALPEEYTQQAIERGRKLAESLQALGADVTPEAETLKKMAEQLASLPDEASVETRRELDRRVRWSVRSLSLKNPLLDFDEIVFIKRAPGLFPHVSDQYYGWWSRGGGGVCVLSGFKGEYPQVRCLTEDWPVGSFLRPDLSHDGKRVLFAWCRHYPHVAAMDKVDKEQLPEDTFYHIYEMNTDGSGRRQLTRGYYDDFDARYLPTGEIVFLSTRKGLALQAGQQSAAATTETTCPDSYVRCGGGNHRPVAVFTLHVMNGNGKDLRAISAFENFEWTPSVSNDGRVLYARWDYIDRFNGHFFSLWSTNPDGTNAQLVYGNYTKQPQCVFEAQAIPNSEKLIFTATAHHSITGGSLALLDRRLGSEYERPLTRLTPEVCFPETEGWPDTYYAGPHPLSEEYFLTSWSDRPLPKHRLMPPDDPGNPRNALGLYLYDAFGNLTLLHRDPEISSMNAIPIRPRPTPPLIADNVDWKAPKEGRFLVQDVYEGLGDMERGSIKRLRVIGVPPKVQPHMNSPVLGVSREDPGKFVLGTVPVEEDGSAYFRVPSGIAVLFQVLDADGLALQTMRSLTYVQPGNTLSCVGCHESRDASPLVGSVPLAARREPSRLQLGPDGSWPLRYDRLVQPVLDKHCVSCHKKDGSDAQAAKFVLTPDQSYQNLLEFADGDLRKLAFEKDRSVPGDCPARKSQLLELLTRKDGHYDVRLAADDVERLTTWMDTYAHRLGSFSDQQEEDLRQLQHKLATMLVR